MGPGDQAEGRALGGSPCPVGAGGLWPPRCGGAGGAGLSWLWKSLSRAGASTMAGGTQAQVGISAAPARRVPWAGLPWGWAHQLQLLGSRGQLGLCPGTGPISPEGAGAEPSPHPKPSSPQNREGGAQPVTTSQSPSVCRSNTVPTSAGFLQPEPGVKKPLEQPLSRVPSEPRSSFHGALFVPQGCSRAQACPTYPKASRGGTVTSRGRGASGPGG